MFSSWGDDLHHSRQQQQQQQQPQQPQQQQQQPQQQPADYDYIFNAPAYDLIDNPAIFNQPNQSIDYTPFPFPRDLFRTPPPPFDFHNDLVPNSHHLPNQHHQHQHPHPHPPPHSSQPVPSHKLSHDYLKQYKHDSFLFDDYPIPSNGPQSLPLGHPPNPISVPIPVTLPAPSPQDLSLRSLSAAIDDRPRFPSISSDLASFVRPYLDQYVLAHNRIALGERTLIVLSSKVAQKSYGTEKRFLCPPPTAIMIGNSWWSASPRSDNKLAPPRCVISISGEPTPQEAPIDWSSASGKPFDILDPPSSTTYLGRCVGKQLFISDVDEKKKKVEALVKVKAPLADDEPERIIGTFPSRPIKVISKPSKKRQSAKNLELCINHGSTISLFHRLRSQTVSTKYLCVSGSGASFKGSDGQLLVGVDQHSRSATPSFIARTASWDPFIMYIVDVTKSPSGIETAPPPPPQIEYPSPPPNAIPFTNNGSPIPIYYNQTVVLQCLTSGVVSPVLIIRKVDHATVVVGGGLQEGAKNVADHYCAPGEVCGDPVSQLHKIAFEVYDTSKSAPQPGTTGMTGSFLSCMGEKVNTFRPTDARQWTRPRAASRGSDSPTMPPSPVPSTPRSSLGGGSIASSEYFAGPLSAGIPDSISGSFDLPSSDGGRVKRNKARPGTPGSVTGGNTTTGTSKAARRRHSSAGSFSSSARNGSGYGNGDHPASSGALWQIDIGETSVWTIVGTDQVRYNFYIPPQLFGAFNPSLLSIPRAFPIPAKPLTPFPAVVKYLPHDRAAETPKASVSGSRGGTLLTPSTHLNKMITVYGENFSKADPVAVFFGSHPSPFVEVRCPEVLGCSPPEEELTMRVPIILVRSDGVIFPSNVLYP